jgi:hypothetical protein
MNTPNIVWLLIFYAVGWISGYLAHKERSKGIFDNTVKTIKRKLDFSPVGPVNRPTAKDLYEKTDPQAKKLKETTDAMRELLPTILK